MVAPVREEYEQNKSVKPTGRVSQSQAATSDQGEGEGNVNTIFCIDWTPGRVKSSSWFVHVPKVKVALKAMPCFSWDLALQSDVLSAIAETANADILSTEPCEALVQVAWEHYRCLSFSEFILSLLSLILLLISSLELSAGRDAAPGLTVLIAVILAKKLLEEAFQMPAAWPECSSKLLKRWIHVRKNFKDKYIIAAFGRLILVTITTIAALPMLFLKHSLRPRNFADVLYLVCGGLATRSMLLGSQLLGGEGKAVLALFAALSWWKCLYHLRGEAWFGPRFLPIVRALKDTTAFFLVVVVAIAANTHAYLILEPRSDPNPVYASFMQIFRLGVLGDFDLFEFEGLDPIFEVNSDSQLEPVDPEPGPDYVAVHMLFYTTSIGITILLMNLLIGVLGSNYEMYEDQSRQLFLQERACMLLDLQRQPWHALWCCLANVIRQRVRPRRGWDDIIWFIAREGPGVEESRSLRSTVRQIVNERQNAADKKVEALSERVGKKMDDTDKKVEALEGHVLGLHGKIDQLFEKLSTGELQ
eukprot:TRINITY_DN36015_c0_g1_i1.p1 TRINITY_DN36015_c0_g1~~TRINITY_DN36015_c0_g1_i1.p1  ORF type:complete len:597 (+),score=95.48 TRINITY_DN36015_c0_g1_i1:201-1793(+)